MLNSKARIGLFDTKYYRKIHITLHQNGYAVIKKKFFTDAHSKR